MYNQWMPLETDLILHFDIHIIRLMIFTLLDFLSEVSDSILYNILHSIITNNCCILYNIILKDIVSS